VGTLDAVHQGEKAYLVVLPGGGKTLYHAVSGTSEEELTDSDFTSNADRGIRRYWPDEDAADYHGISCFGTPEQTFENAVIHDRARKRGETPRWRGVAEFVVDGHAGHVFGDTYEPGHWTAWGAPQDFRSNVQAVFPIPD
jgi:hypothetical protein